MGQIESSTQEDASFPPLRPLRIPSGWKLVWNTLYDVEPGTADEAKWLHNETVVMLEKDHWLVDVTWRDPVGYRLSVIDLRL